MECLRKKRTQMIDQANVYSQVILPFRFVMILMWLHMRKMKNVSVIPELVYCIFYRIVSPAQVPNDILTKSYNPSELKLVWWYDTNVYSNEITLIGWVIISLADPNWWPQFMFAICVLLWQTFSFPWVYYWVKDTTRQIMDIDMTSVLKIMFIFLCLHVNFITGRWKTGIGKGTKKGIIVSNFDWPSLS